MIKRFNKKKRVLFINPGNEVCGVPNLGLGMLSSVLKKEGYKVLVADYNFSASVPPLPSVVKSFTPDVIGISLFSYMWQSLDEILKFTEQLKIPIICGGPHTSSYFEEMLKDNRLDYVVVGEAEDEIVAIIENAKKNSWPEMIKTNNPKLNKPLFPNYDSLIDKESIRIYPILTSRGCPYDCSFCSIHLSNSKTWRVRETEHCMQEIKHALANYPGIEEISFWDDNFSFNLHKSKEILRKCEELYPGIRFSIANVRADKIDEEFIYLAEKIGCQEIQFGVEHGNPEVFKKIRKSESLDDIKRAAGLLKKSKLKLGCSFIIGLPGDSVDKTYESVSLAEELNYDHCHWNVLVPYKGTEVYNYFKKYGKIDDFNIPPTVHTFLEPFYCNAETDYFTKEERQKALCIALLLTGEMTLKADLSVTERLVEKFGLEKEYFVWRKKTEQSKVA